MVNISEQLKSVFVYSSLYYLCQFGPVPTDMKWTRRDKRRPSKSIVTINKEDQSFFVRLLNPSHNSSKKMSQYHRFRIHPKEEIATNQPPPIIEILNCSDEPVLTRGVADWKALGKLTTAEAEWLLDEERVSHLRTLWKLSRQSFEAAYAHVMKQNKATGGDVSKLHVPEDPDTMAQLSSLWVKTMQIDHDVPLKMVAPHTEKNILAFVRTCFLLPSATTDEPEVTKQVEEKTVSARLNALEQQIRDLMQMTKDEKTDMDELRDLLKKDTRGGASGSGTNAGAGSGGTVKAPPPPPMPRSKQKALLSAAGLDTVAARPAPPPPPAALGAEDDDDDEEEDDEVIVPAAQNDQVILTDCRTWGPLKERFNGQPAALFRYVCEQLDIKLSALKGMEAQDLYNDFSDCFFQHCDKNMKDGANASYATLLNDHLEDLVAAAHAPAEQTTRQRETDTAFTAIPLPQEALNPIEEMPDITELLNALVALQTSNSEGVPISHLLSAYNSDPSDDNAALLLDALQSPVSPN